MTSAEQLFAEAMAAFRASDEPGAEALLRLALRQDPQHTPSLSLLALVAGRAGRNAEAARLLEQARRRLAGAEAAAAEQRLAAAYAREGDPKKQFAIAEQIQKRVLDLGVTVPLGQFVQPMARRRNVSGNIASPVTVFWNVEKK